MAPGFSLIFFLVDNQTFTSVISKLRMQKTPLEDTSKMPFSGPHSRGFHLLSLNWGSENCVFNKHPHVIFMEVVLISL